MDEFFPNIYKFITQDPCRLLKMVKTGEFQVKFMQTKDFLTGSRLILKQYFVFK
jgi:hypothetical protein